MSYVRVSILGTASGGEVWSINPVFDPEGEFPGTVDQAALDAACLAIANLTPASGLLSAMSSMFSITGARLEVRDDATDGLLAISTQTRTTAQPGSGTVTHPPQSAIVFSLRTNTPGGSGRGRIYWPYGGGNVTSAGRIAAVDITAWIAQMKTYLNAMAAALATAFPLIGFVLSVRSRATHTTPHVVRMLVGDVVDTQRRRRDHLAEVYQQVTMPESSRSYCRIRPTLLRAGRPR